MKETEASKAVIKKAESKLKTAYIDFENGQYDDAVSRAYYAVFHMLTAVLLSKGNAFSSHSQTIGNFNREFIKTGIFPKGFSRMIQDLFDDRQTGDYDVISYLDRSTAEKDIKNADAICKSIKEYLNII
jgi:hypothetical protein